MPAVSGWHAGEIAAQQARGFEDDVFGMYQMVREGLTNGMQPFLEALPFIPLTTLDNQGRPWGSILALDGQPGFMEPLGATPEEVNKVRIRSRLPPGTPAIEALVRASESDEDVLCAAVGIMYNNRRRNKFEGKITHVQQSCSTSAGDADYWNFWLDVTSTMGNCPKYINVRSIIPLPQSVADSQTLEPAAFDAPQGQAVPEQLLDHVRQAEMIYLHTKHTAEPNSYDHDRLGCNIRGGKRGFLRTYWDEQRQRTAIVLPDWSGNRMMQSFGNAMHDGVAGLTIPVWGLRTSAGYTPSSVVHVTGEAEVLAGEDIQKLLPGVAGALRLWVTGWSHTASLPLVVDAREAEARALAAEVQLDQAQLLDASLGWSPYNPKVRLLASERDTAAALGGEAGAKAQLVSAKLWSDTLATFTWRVNAQAASRWSAGRHIILDANAVIDTRVKMYQHMSHFPGGEKDLNDDGIRSWTISAARPLADGQLELDTTLRRAPRGAVTPGLFNRARVLASGGPVPTLELPLLGIEGEMLLPALQDAAQPLLATYFVAGIGITPLLAHVSELRNLAQAAKVLVVLGSRAEDGDALLDMIAEAAGPDSCLQIKIHWLTSSSNAPSTPSNLSLEPHVGARLNRTSLLASSTADFHLDAADAEHVSQSSVIVVCGAPKFADVAQAALAQANIAKSRIFAESFAF